MGTRLIIVSMLCIMFACQTKKENLYSSEDEFLLAYKTAVLYGCINSATNNNLSKFSRDNNDLELAPVVAVIYHAETDSAVNLGMMLSNRIKVIDYSDYQGKSPIFKDCVTLAFSKEVDSIARNMYKKGKNAKMEYVHE